MANTLTKDQFMSRSMKQDIYQVNGIIINLKFTSYIRKKRSSHKIGLKKIFFNLFDYAKTVKCLMTYAKSNK